MPAMVATLLAGANAKVTGGGCSICVHISEWVAGDVSSRLHLCHHVYPGRGMIKTMTKYFDLYYLYQKINLSHRIVNKQTVCVYPIATPLIFKKIWKSN